MAAETTLPALNADPVLLAARRRVIARFLADPPTRVKDWPQEALERLAEEVGNKFVNSSSVQTNMGDARANLAIQLRKKAMSLKAGVPHLKGGQLPPALQTKILQIIALDPADMPHAVLLAHLPHLQNIAGALERIGKVSVEAQQAQSQAQVQQAVQAEQAAAVASAIEVVRVTDAQTYAASIGARIRRYHEALQMDTPEAVQRARYIWNELYGSLVGWLKTHGPTAVESFADSADPNLAMFRDAFVNPGNGDWVVGPTFSGSANDLRVYKPEWKPEEGDPNLVAEWVWRANGQQLDIDTFLAVYEHAPGEGDAALGTILAVEGGTSTWCVTGPDLGDLARARDFYAGSMPKRESTLEVDLAGIEQDNNAILQSAKELREAGEEETAVEIEDSISPLTPLKLDIAHRQLGKLRGLAAEGTGWDEIANKLTPRDPWIPLEALTKYVNENLQSWRDHWLALYSEAGRALDHNHRPDGQYGDIRDNAERTSNFAPIRLEVVRDQGLYMYRANAGHVIGPSTTWDDILNLRSSEESEVAWTDKVKAMNGGDSSYGSWAQHLLPLQQGTPPTTHQGIVLPLILPYALFSAPGSASTLKLGINYSFGMRDDTGLGNAEVLGGTKLRERVSQRAIYFLGYLNNDYRVFSPGSNASRAYFGRIWGFSTARTGAGRAQPDRGQLYGVPWVGSFPDNFAYGEIPPDRAALVDARDNPQRSDYSGSLIPLNEDLSSYASGATLSGDLLDAELVAGVSPAGTPVQVANAGVGTYGLLGRIVSRPYNPPSVPRGAEELVGSRLTLWEYNQGVPEPMGDVMRIGRQIQQQRKQARIELYQKLYTSDFVAFMEDDSTTELQALLIKRYNEVWTGFIPPAYDPQENIGTVHLDERIVRWDPRAPQAGRYIPGTRKQLYGYQSEGALRLDDQGGGLLAYAVGVGKTLTAQAACAWAKQQGRAKRALFIVPDTIQQKWYEHFADELPDWNCAILGEVYEVPTDVKGTSLMGDFNAISNVLRKVYMSHLGKNWGKPKGPGPTIKDSKERSKAKGQYCKDKASEVASTVLLKGGKIPTADLVKGRPANYKVKTLLKTNAPHLLTRTFHAPPPQWVSPGGDKGQEEKARKWTRFRDGYYDALICNEYDFWTLKVSDAFVQEHIQRSPAFRLTMLKKAFSQKVTTLGATGTQLVARMAMAAQWVAHAAESTAAKGGWAVPRDAQGNVILPPDFPRSGSTWQQDVLTWLNHRVNDLRTLSGPWWDDLTDFFLNSLFTPARSLIDTTARGAYESLFREPGLWTVVDANGFPACLPIAGRTLKLPASAGVPIPYMGGIGWTGRGAKGNHRAQLPPSLLALMGKGAWFTAPSTSTAGVMEAGVLAWQSQVIELRAAVPWRYPDGVVGTKGNSYFQADYASGKVQGLPLATREGWQGLTATVTGENAAQAAADWLNSNPGYIDNVRLQENLDPLPNMKLYVPYHSKTKTDAHFKDDSTRTMTGKSYKDAGLPTAYTPPFQIVAARDPHKSIDPKTGLGAKIYLAGLAAKDQEGQAKLRSKLPILYATQEGPTTQPEVFWDDLKVDYILVDEAHKFKGLYSPQARGAKVWYLGEGQTATRAWMLDARCSDVKSRGGQVVLLTATPAKTSPLEIYNVLQFVGARGLDAHDSVFTQYDLFTSEQFISRFIYIEDAVVIKTTGEAIRAPRAMKFTNLQEEFVRVFHRYADYKTVDDVVDLRGIEVATGCCATFLSDPEADPTIVTLEDAAENAEALRGLTETFIKLPTATAGDPLLSLNDVIPGERRLAIQTGDAAGNYRIEEVGVGGNPGVLRVYPAIADASSVTTTRIGDNWAIYVGGRVPLSPPPEQVMIPMDQTQNDTYLSYQRTLGRIIKNNLRNGTVWLSTGSTAGLIPEQIAIANGINVATGGKGDPTAHPPIPAGGYMTNDEIEAALNAIGMMPINYALTNASQIYGSFTRIALHPELETVVARRAVADEDEDEGSDLDEDDVPTEATGARYALGLAHAMSPYADPDVWGSVALADAREKGNPIKASTGASIRAQYRRLLCFYGSLKTIPTRSTGRGLDASISVTNDDTSLVKGKGSLPATYVTPEWPGTGGYIEANQRMKDLQRDMDHDPEGFKQSRPDEWKLLLVLREWLIDPTYEKGDKEGDTIPMSDRPVWARPFKSVPAWSQIGQLPQIEPASSRVAGVLDRVLESLWSDETLKEAAADAEAVPPVTCGHLAFADNLMYQAWSAVYFARAYALTRCCAGELQTYAASGVPDAHSLDTILKDYLGSQDPATGRHLPLPLTARSLLLNAYPGATEGARDATSRAVYGVLDKYQGALGAAEYAFASQGFDILGRFDLLHMEHAQGEPSMMRRASFAKTYAHEDDAYWLKLQTVYTEKWIEGARKFGIMNGELVPSEDRMNVAKKFNGAFTKQVTEVDGERVENMVATVEPEYDLLFANKVAYEGVDLQLRTCLVHMADLPWTPADYIQRRGRAVRQGAIFKEVGVVVYLTDGTIDFYRLQALERKSEWLESALQASRSDWSLTNSEEELLERAIQAVHIEDREAVRLIVQKKMASIRRERRAREFTSVTGALRVGSDQARRLMLWRLRGTEDSAKQSIKAYRKVARAFSEVNQPPGQGDYVYGGFYKPGFFTVCEESALYNVVTGVSVPEQAQMVQPRLSAPNPAPADPVSRSPKVPMVEEALVGVCLSPENDGEFESDKAYGFGTVEPGSPAVASQVSFFPVAWLGKMSANIGPSQNMIANRYGVLQFFKDGTRLVTPVATNKPLSNSPEYIEGKDEYHRHEKMLAWRVLSPIQYERYLEKKYGRIGTRDVDGAAIAPLSVLPTFKLPDAAPQMRPAPSLGAEVAPDEGAAAEAEREKLKAFGLPEQAVPGTSPKWVDVHEGKLPPTEGRALLGGLWSKDSMPLTVRRPTVMVTALGHPRIRRREWLYPGQLGRNRSKRTDSDGEISINWSRRGSGDNSEYWYDGIAATANDERAVDLPETPPNVKPTGKGAGKGRRKHQAFPVVGKTPEGNDDTGVYMIYQGSGGDLWPDRHTYDYPVVLGLYPEGYKVKIPDMDAFFVPENKVEVPTKDQIDGSSDPLPAEGRGWLVYRQTQDSLIYASPDMVTEKAKESVPSPEARASRRERDAVENEGPLEGIKWRQTPTEDWLVNTLGMHTYNVPQILENSLWLYERRYTNSGRRSEEKKDRWSWLSYVSDEWLTAHEEVVTEFILRKLKAIFYTESGELLSHDDYMNDESRKNRDMNTRFPFVVDGKLLIIQKGSMKSSSEFRELLVDLPLMLLDMARRGEDPPDPAAIEKEIKAAEKLLAKVEAARKPAGVELTGAKQAAKSAEAKIDTAKKGITKAQEKVKTMQGGVAAAKEKGRPIITAHDKLAAKGTSVPATVKTKYAAAQAEIAKAEKAVVNAEKAIPKAHQKVAAAQEAANEAHRTTEAKEAAVAAADEAIVDAKAGVAEVAKKRQIQQAMNVKLLLPTREGFATFIRLARECKYSSTLDLTPGVLQAPEDPQQAGKAFTSCVRQWFTTSAQLASKHIDSWAEGSPWLAEKQKAASRQRRRKVRTGGAPTTLEDLQNSKKAIKEQRDKAMADYLAKQAADAKGNGNGGGQ